MKFINKKLKILFLFSTLCFLSSAFFALAAELKYFDFSPDISGSLNISTSETPYQYFIHYDDYISGFDLWVENTGSAGTASFGLRDSNDNLLEAKTISIPYLAKQWGGQKIHVQFDQPVNVSSTEIYKIKMLSSMPKLKIYYGNLVNLQLHNANETQDPHIKPAYLGNNEQNFAFKFSLYEDGDVLAPVISNINVSILSDTKAKFDFNANEPVDYKIIYWPINEPTQQTNYSGNYVSCQSGIKTCSLEIPVLPNKNYVYQLFAKDIWGNESQYEGTFVSSIDWTPENSTSSATSSPPAATSTEILPDTFGPVISDVNIIFISEKSLKVSWRTDEAANSSLLIGLNVPGQQVITSIGDTTYELEHVMESGDILAADKNYYARIASIDSLGNYSSYEFTFDTFADSLTVPPEQNPPDNLNQDQQNENNEQQQPLLEVIIEESGVGIFWNNSGDNSSGYRIDVFDGNKKLVKQILLSQYDYNAAITDLAAGDYYLIVYNNNNGIYEKVAAAENFSIRPREPQSYLDLKGLLKNPFFYISIFGLLAIAASIVLYFLKKIGIKEVGQ